MRLSQLLIILMLCRVDFAHSQQPDIQKLANEYIAKSKTHFSNVDSCLYYASQAYQLVKHSTYTREIAESAKMMGVASHINTEFDDAITYYEESLALFQKLNDTLETGKAYLNLATTYSSLSAYEETVTNAL